MPNTIGRDVVTRSPDGSVAVLGSDGFGAVRSADGDWSDKVPRGTFTDPEASLVKDLALALKLSSEARIALSAQPNNPLRWATR
jgi:hypothetical protein